MLQGELCKFRHWEEQELKLFPDRVNGAWGALWPWGAGIGEFVMRATPVMPHYDKVPVKVHAKESNGPGLMPAPNRVSPPALLGSADAESTLWRGGRILTAIADAVIKCTVLHTMCISFLEY